MVDTGLRIGTDIAYQNVFSDQMEFYETKTDDLNLADVFIPKPDPNLRAPEDWKISNGTYTAGSELGLDSRTLTSMEDYAYYHDISYEDYITGAFQYTTSAGFYVPSSTMFYKNKYYQFYFVGDSASSPQRMNFSRIYDSSYINTHPELLMNEVYGNVGNYAFRQEHGYPFSLIAVAGDNQVTNFYWRYAQYI